MDASCTTAGDPRDPVFTGDFSFNTARVKQITPFDYIWLIATFIISLSISAYFAWKSDLHMALDEYLLAGRSMKALPVGLSLLASFLSAITMIGGPAEMYDYDTSYFLTGIAFFFTCLFAADIYVPVFFQLRLVTVYEYLELRFSRGVRTAAALLFVAQMILYMALALYTPSVAFHGATGLSLWGSILSVGIISTVYTALGGMKAVLWTDSFQVGIMFVSLVVTLCQASLVVGSWDLVYNSALRTNRIHFLDFRIDPTIRHTVWSLITGGTFVHLSIYAVNQAQIHRCLSCRTLKQAKIAIWMNFPGNVILLYLSCIIGLYMAAFYENCDPVKAKLVKTSNEILPLFSMDILSDITGLPGVLLAGVFSSTLSTVSSGLNSIAAVILEDFIKCYVKTPIKEHRARLFSQIISVIFGFVCLEFTYLVSKIGSILEAVHLVFGMLATPVLGVFSLGLFFPWANNEGAKAGLFSSLAVLGLLKIENILTVQRPLQENALTCVSNCNISAFPAETQSILREPYEPPEFTDPDVIDPLYRLSYLWYPMCGALITVAIGLIVSYATGFQDPKDLDPRLIVSICDVTFPFYYLPETTKAFFRFGMEHKGKFEGDFQKRHHSYVSKWVENTLPVREERHSSVSKDAMQVQSRENVYETEL